MSNRKPPAAAAALAKLPRYAKMTAAQYHADKTALGRSALWTFHQSRRSYEAEWPYAPFPRPENAVGAPPKKKSKPMDIGTLCHYGLLEPEKFPTQYAVFPKSVLDSRGYETTTAAEKFRAEHEAAGRVVLKQADFEIVEQVVESVRWKLGNLGWLGVEARREQAVYWTEPTTGLPCKTLLDWLIEGRQTAFVLDFKTSQSADPRAFRYTCEDFGYWFQDAHYSEGAGLVTRKPVEFVFVVGETKFPFRTSVQRLSARDRQAAADTRRRTMADLAQCLRTGDFSETWEDSVSELTLRQSSYE